MAAASDFFKQLSAGVRFDRKRPDSRAVRAQSADKCDPSLPTHVVDFFNEAVRPSVTTEKSRRQDSRLPPRSEHSDEQEEHAAIGDIAVFRKAMRINVKGENVADPIGRFEDLQVVTARVESTPVWQPTHAWCS